LKNFFDLIFIFGLTGMLFLTEDAHSFNLTHTPYPTYHPVDSAFYVTYPCYTEDFESGAMLFKITQNGAFAEHIYTFPFPQEESRTISHDWVEGRIWGWDMDNRGGDQHMVSRNGGRSWERLDLPFHRGYMWPGSNPGESFGYSYFGDHPDYTNLLLCTQDGWESWDSSYVPELWPDIVIYMGFENGALFGKPVVPPEDILYFSSDTGRSWTEVELEEELPGVRGEFSSFTVLGPGTDLYQSGHGQIRTFYCVRDSGRTVTELINLMEYDNYDTTSPEGVFWWKPELTPTNTPGECFITTSWESFEDPLLVILHLFHVTDYGENVTRYVHVFDVDLTDNGIEDQYAVKPKTFVLNPAFPNPFNSTTTISYELLLSCNVSLELCNLFGQRVSTLFEGQQQAGVYATKLTANNLSSGLYFIRLSSLGQVFKRKVILVR